MCGRCVFLGSRVYGFDILKALVRRPATAIAPQHLTFERRRHPQRAALRPSMCSSMQQLQIEIPESLVPLPAYSTSRSSSSPPSSWVNHSPGRRAPSLPSPVSPVIVHTELSPIRSERNSTPDHSETQPSDVTSPPKNYVEVEPPSPSVASLVDYTGNRASRTDLMGVVLTPHSPAVPFVAPIPPRPLRRTSGSLRPRPHTVPTSSRPHSPVPTPPSATALSSMANSPQEEHPKDDSIMLANGAKPAVTAKSSARPLFHDMFYIRDEMVVLSVSVHDR